MQYSIYGIADRFRQMNMDGKAVEITHWTKDDEVNELKVLLKSIYPGYDESVKSWSQVNSKFSILFKIRRSLPST